MVLLPVLILCALAVAVPPQAPAAAQGPPPADAPPVEQLVGRALSRAPSLAARRTRVESAELGSKAADALPDPMVEFEYRAGGFPRYTIGSDPGSMLGALVRQDLLSKGRRTARRETATATIAQNRASLDAAASSVATRVRLGYARVFVLDRERETLVDALQLLALLEATVSARYAAGASDQASVLRVQLERSRVGERMADLAAERQAAVADLNRLTDDDPLQPLGLVRALPERSPDAPSAAEVLPRVAELAPDLAMRRADLLVAERRVAEMRQEQHLAWSVGAGLYWQGGLNRMATFSVGLELPFWKARKQAPLLAAAEREREAARADIADASSEVRAEAARLVTAWQTAQDQIDRYKEAILPQSAAALDATRSGYLAGRGDFAAVLDEFRRWIDVRVSLGRREADRYSARVALDALCGAASSLSATTGAAQ
jgi:cobalt-zinc-cadmium efflux system outer membrane protein